MTKLDKKGFTLIEIIAAIIILGIIMIIAVPNVSRIIVEERKNTYIVNAERFVNSARDFVNSESVKMDSQTITYYIPRTCLSVDKGSRSPYGDWDQVFVVVTFDGTKYDYYFAANDVTKTGIELTYSEDLNINRVVSNVEQVDVKRSIGMRNSTLVFTNSCKESDAVKYTATSNIGDHESYEGNTSTLIINSVTVDPNDWHNGDIQITGTATDEVKGITGCAFSKYKSLDKDSSEWETMDNTKDLVSCYKTVSENNLYYFYVRNGDDEIEKKAVSIAIIDKEKPSCKIIGTSNIQCTDNVGIIAYYYGPLDPRTQLSEITWTNIDQIKNFYHTEPSDFSTKKFLIAKDLAGNLSGVVSNQEEIDTDEPVCTIVKTMAGYSVGVTLTIICQDEAGGSGCDSSRNITGERGVKTSRTYTLYDNAGNSTTCSVNIEPTDVIAGLVCKRNKPVVCPDNPLSVTTEKYKFNSTFLKEQRTCEQLGFTWVQSGGGLLSGSSGYCYRSYTRNRYSAGLGRYTYCSDYTSNVDDCLQWSQVVRYRATSSLWRTYCHSSRNNSFEKFLCSTVYY